MSVAIPNIKTKTAGGCPAASYLLLRRQKKVTQEKAPPVCRRCADPCVARLVRRLRNSRCALRQSSPTPPDQPALLGGAQGREKQKSKPYGGQYIALHSQNNSTPNIGLSAGFFLSSTLCTTQAPLMIHLLIFVLRYLKKSV